MALKVERADSGRAIKEFAVLPATLYRQEAAYVAPLDLEQVETVHPRKAAFFTHGRAAYFIARRDGVACGRISAQIDDLLPGGGRGGIGLFGCFDAIDDAEVAHALTDAAETWLRGEGCVTVRGPFSLSINGQSGLMTGGQHHSPMTMMPWHPAYLDGLLQGCGYPVAKRLSSWELVFGNAPSRLLEMRRPASWSLRKLRMNRLDEELEICRTLFNDAWHANWGFTPLSQAEMRAFAKSLRHLVFPDCGAFVETPEGPVAFAIVLPNFYELFSDLGRSPSILGWGKFLWRAFRQNYRSGRVILLGVASRFQASATAAAALLAMLAQLQSSAQARGLKSIEAGWILEDNYPMIRILEAVGFSRVRTYNVYEKSLGGSPGVEPADRRL